MFKLIKGVAGAIILIIKAAVHIFSIGVPLVITGYHLYGYFQGRGEAWVNLTLAALSLSSAVVYISTVWTKKKRAKRIRREAKKISKLVKRLVNLAADCATLAIMISSAASGDAALGFVDIVGIPLITVLCFIRLVALVYQVFISISAARAKKMLSRGVREKANEAKEAIVGARDRVVTGVRSVGDRVTNTVTGVKSGISDGIGRGVSGIRSALSRARRALPTGRRESLPEPEKADGTSEICIEAPAEDSTPVTSRTDAEAPKEATPVTSRTDAEAPMNVTSASDDSAEPEGAASTEDAAPVSRFLAFASRFKKQKK